MPGREEAEVVELELEESELFDDDDDDDLLDRAASPGPARDTPTPAAVFTAGTSDDEEEAAGLRLDLDDGDTSDSERLAQRLASLQSSVDHTEPMEAAVRAAELTGLEGPGSRVGSLKRFDSVGRPHRGFGSEGDLGLAASVPARPTPIAAALRRDAAAAELDDQYSHLGTSMPIRIPMLHRRGLAASPGSAEGRGAGFVPPHLLDLHADATASGAASFRDSPSQAVKREKLMARNAILRSTGFIEGRSAFAAPNAMGEVLDAVKEAAMQQQEAAAAEAAGAAGGLLRFQRRPTAASSLTAMLSSSH